MEYQNRKKHKKKYLKREERKKDKKEFRRIEAEKREKIKFEKEKKKEDRAEEKLVKKQPRSQGSLLHERETLENAGHVSPRRKRNPGGVPVSESFVSTKFCKHQNEAHYFSTSIFASSIAATRISILKQNK